eukprot:2081051-Alexandrium_andersonii.AAC.1
MASLSSLAPSSAQETCRALPPAALDLAAAGLPRAGGAPEMAPQRGASWGGCLGASGADRGGEAQAGPDDCPPPRL